MGKLYDPGFDVDAAADRLLGIFVDEGGVARNDPRVVMASSPNGPTAENQDERRRRASVLFHVANEHHYLHGVHQGEPRCAQWPCRRLGLSGALMEMAEFMVARESPEFAAAVGVAKLRAACGQTRAMKTFLASGEDRNRRDADAAIACAEMRVFLFKELPYLTARLKHMEAELRSLLWSNQLRQRSWQKRTEALLAAVYQHLHYGGAYTYPQIADLKLAATTEAERKREVTEEDVDRVKKRVISKSTRSKSESWRGHLSREDLPGKDAPPSMSP